MKKIILLVQILLLIYLIGCKKKDSSIVEPKTLSNQWFVFDNPNDTIRNMAQSANFIWAATHNNGLLRIDKLTKESIRFNPSNSALTENLTTSVAVDANGIVWVGTEYKGLLRYDGNNWSTFNKSNSAIPSDSVRFIAFDNETVWVGTLKGIGLLEGTNWTTLTRENSGLTDNYIRNISRGFDGKMWIGTRSGGLLCTINNTWTVYDSLNTLMKDNAIRTIESDLNGDIWTASYAKCYHFKDGIWRIYDQSNSGISSDFVNDIAVQENGTVYFSTHVGFSSFNGIEWSTFFVENSPLPHNIAESVIIDQYNNKWIGTFGGIAIFNEEGIK